MTAPPDQPRIRSVLMLLLAALVGGAIAGLATASFIWLFESLIHLVWHDLPDALGVDPYDSWFLFAVPVVGGVVVGLGQQLLGNYPKPINENVATWRSGGHIEPRTIPGTAFNSLAALVAGGPVGFEAALTGLLGGVATLISRAVGSTGRLVRQAWGGEQLSADSALLRSGPYWLAALAGLFTYRWLPFGQLDLAFRLASFDGTIGPLDGVTVFGFAVVLAVPVGWALAIVVRAEQASHYVRSPILIGALGGLVIAALASVHEYVLFSGQEGARFLPTLATGTVWYIAGAKWLALVVVMLAGWRGGPIFPMFTVVAALAVGVHGVLHIEPELLMVGGIAVVSVLLLRGNIPMAFVLTLYAVPVAYAGVILLGAAGGVVGLGIARPLGLLPTPLEHAPHGPAPDELSGGPDAA